MLERIIGSTSTSNNIHEVVDDNSNLYRSMMIDVMRMSHAYSNEGSHVDEEPNIDATKLFLTSKFF
jgi:hypothetical protein